MTPSIVYRALVTYSDTTTGEIRVQIPAVTGQSELSISYIGRTKHSGSWVVPTVGSQIVVSADDELLTNLFWIQTDALGTGNGGGGGATILDDLTDVTAPYPVSGDILSWNGSQWVNIENFAEATKHYVKNDTGGTLAVGSAVYTHSANGTNILVRKAQANAESTSATILGIMAETLGVNGIGKVVTQGLIAGFNTSTATAGDPVWLSPTVAGGLAYGLANKPSAPNHLVYIGVVTRSNNVNGEIFVNISNGWELEELHNVSISSPTTGDILKWNGSLWVNAQPSGSSSSGVSVSDTPPSSPTAGQLWFESDTGKTFIYYDSFWVELNGGTLSSTYTSDTPPASPTVGTLWYETDSGALYVYYDSFWIEIGPGAAYNQIVGSIQAKGDLIVGTGSQAITRQPVGTDGYRLVADSTTSTGVAWVSGAVNNTIDAKGDILAGTADNTMARVGVGADGQVLTATSSATTGLAWANPAVGFRNVLINGNFDIWQRGTSFTNAANASFSADRAYTQINGTSINVDITRDTSVPNARSKYSIKFQQKTSNATSVTEYGYRQYVEGTVAQALYGRTVAVSFWYKSNKTGSHGIRIYGSYATGGDNYQSTFTVNAADTWEYKTFVTAVPFGGITANNVTPTDPGALVQVGFTANSNGFSSVSANDYFQIAQLQMEANTVPTPFEQRPIGVELALCQRYYYRLGNTSVSGAYLTFNNHLVYSANSIEGAIQHPVPMRTHAISITSSSIYAYNVVQGNWNAVPRTPVSAAYNTTTHARIVTDRSGGTDWSAYYSGTSQMAFALVANGSSGYIDISAEL